MKSILVQKILDSERMEYLHEKGKVYTFLNPVSYLDALKHKELFSRFDGIFADGSLLVGAIRMLYGKNVTRRSCDWTSIARDVFHRAEDTGETIYLIGTMQEELELTISNFRKHCSKAKIVGGHHGYFSSQEEKVAAVKEMLEAKPDFLLVGMGIVKQEEMLLLAKDMGFEGIGFTCGGFLHQTAQPEVEYYPQWIDRMNLRFLYRMYKEPYTRKRYFMGGLKFPLLFLWDRFFEKR